tara:strand:+ start:1708 stop:2394 length:687 start_codon:yes stop_codon:yes gene_type:complete
MIANDGLEMPVMGQEQERLYVEFYKETVQDTVKTAEAGRPIFRDADYIKIMAPGGKDNVVVREVRRNGCNNPNLNDDKRFPQQWAAYQNGQSQQENIGTPCSECPAISNSMAEELKHFNIHTLEQLIEAPDNTGIMGFNNMKNAAVAYLDIANGVVRAQEFKKQEEKIADQQKQIDELLAGQNGGGGPQSTEGSQDDSAAGEVPTQETAGGESETDGTPAKGNKRRKR